MTQAELKQKLDYITEGILTNEKRSIERLSQLLSEVEAKAREEERKRIWTEINSLHKQPSYEDLCEIISPKDESEKYHIADVRKTVESEEEG